MPYLSPPTLTRSEQQALLKASAVHPRDHLILSLALGTGLRLSEIIGLNVGDVFSADGRPRGRVRLRREVAKGGRVGDVRGGPRASDRLAARPFDLELDAQYPFGKTAVMA